MIARPILLHHVLAKILMKIATQSGQERKVTGARKKVHLECPSACTHSASVEYRNWEWHIAGERRCPGYWTGIDAVRGLFGDELGALCLSICLQTT